MRFAASEAGIKAKARKDHCAHGAGRDLRARAGPAFGVSTVAIQVANELWLGSVRGDRIAIFPLVQSPPSR